MPGQTATPNLNASLPLQVDINQAVSSREIASGRSTRFVWAAVGFAVLMIIGVFACVLPSHTFTKPSDVATQFGVSPSMSVLRPLASTPSMGMRAVALPGPTGQQKFVNSRMFHRVSMRGGRKATSTMQVPTSYHRMVAAKAGDSVKEVGVIKDEKTPQPGDDEVLVRVMSAGINGGCETFRARGEHAFAGLKDTVEYPLGSEGAGIVLLAGKDSGLQPGDAVAFVGSALSELDLVKARMCTRFGSSLGQVLVRDDYRQATALRISGMTALVALELTGQIKRKQTILITAAAGGTGHFAVQVAKLNGARVVATCSTEEKANVLRDLGADRVVIYTQEDLSTVLKTEFPDGLDLAYEGVGGKLHDIAVDHLKKGGRVLQVGYISHYPKAQGQDADPDSDKAKEMGDAFWSGKTWQLPGDKTVYFNVWEGGKRSKDAVQKSLKRLFQLWTHGDLKALVDPKEFSGLEQAGDAVEYMMSGKSTGKVVLDIANPMFGSAVPA